MMLSIKNIDKSFGNDIVFKDLSIDFDEKGLYVITGKSGIGKTTLLRMIAGLDTDHTGTITGGGITNISIMFQEHRLFPTLSAIDNATVAFNTVDGNNRTLAENLLLRLGFDEHSMSKLPRELSGGMKQRVSFARALLKDSPILLLDEPTKELNRELIETMAEILCDEAKKRLVIVVTHDEMIKNTAGSQIIAL